MGIFKETYKELTEPFTITPITFMKVVLISAALGGLITLISAAGGIIVCIAAGLLLLKDTIRYSQRREGNEKNSAVLPNRRPRH